MDAKRVEAADRRGPALSALAIACLGTALVGLGYSLGEVPFNIDELVGPGVFWVAAVFFLLSVPFREAARIFSRSVRTALGAAVFVLYVSIHLLLYGFLFQAVLAAVYGVGSFATGAGLFVTTNLFSPLSVPSVTFDLAYNPIIVMGVPPVFSTALSFYSISVALVIAVLVVANIGRTRELSELRLRTGKARAFVLLPALGIVFGASCCLSVAGLVSLATPAAGILTSTPWIYYVTYFLFPCIAVAVLYLNLRAMRRVSAWNP
ncbi:MAG TPA: hypothetical protein VLU99_09225 [Nitrososphaerales archaeon]|nr:hypothetical protein [Nitrososphaerales archaeon]